MAYVRFSSDSDVYMFHHVGGFIQCCGCSMGPIVISNMSWLAERLGKTKETDPDLFDDFEMHDSINLLSFEEAIEHLTEHRKRGHLVPERAFTRLENDIKNKTPIK